MTTETKIPALTDLEQRRQALAFDGAHGRDGAEQERHEAEAHLAQQRRAFRQAVEAGSGLEAPSPPTREGGALMNREERTTRGPAERPRPALRNPRRCYQVIAVLTHLWDWNRWELLLGPSVVTFFHLEGAMAEAELFTEAEADALVGWLDGWTAHVTGARKIRHETLPPISGGIAGFAVSRSIYGRLDPLVARVALEPDQIAALMDLVRREDRAAFGHLAAMWGVPRQATDELWDQARERALTERLARRCRLEAMPPRKADTRRTTDDGPTR
jgi:hypothetical protein